MVAPLFHPPTVLLFGPQALSFQAESLEQLRQTLSDPHNRWIPNTIAELPGLWGSLVEHFPKLREVPGEQLLAGLNEWLETGHFTKLHLPLPNILLTPLVSITQLTQFSTYLKLSEAAPGDRYSAYASLKETTETLGFCTGLLAAYAVSSSANEQQFQRHGAAAIRLAMLVGAFVDAQEALDESECFSAAWDSKGSEAELNAALAQFQEAYVSVLYDEKRVTVTSSKSTAPALLDQLKGMGIQTTEVGLRGRFHCQCYRGDLESILRFCDASPAFQLPEASALVFPTRSNSGGSYVAKRKLHHVALQSMLVEQCDWKGTFNAVLSSHLAGKQSRVVSLGLDRCIPPTQMRKLGLRVLHMADMERDSLTNSPHSRRPLEDEADEYIAVVGMSCKVAGADDTADFWKILCEGKSQHVEVPGDRFSFDTLWREMDTQRKWYGNFVRDHDVFDHKFFKKSPREMASTDPQQRLMLQTAYQAVEQSGYFQSPNINKHVGCYIGVVAVDYENNIACYPATAFSAIGNLRSFISGKISHFFGWTGPALSIDTACSGSTVAVHQACRAILNGDCTAALAGGVTIMTSPQWFQNLAAASFLSPTGACKPFDSQADGYCRGEGVGAVFLKKLSSAIADGDQIFGTIAATTVYQNENCTPITVPNSLSLSSLFRDVTRKAYLKPNQISVVEAHGTGTAVGDPAEYDSVRQVFGGPNRSDPLSMGSVKGLIGHTECASGVIALIKTLLMIHQGAIPPQASFKTINPAIKALPSDHIDICTQLKPWEAPFRAALVNNFGASGSNASMVVTEAPCRPLGTSQAPAILSIGQKQPFWLSGFDDNSLRAYAAKFRQFLRTNPDVSIGNLAFNTARQSNRTLGRALILSSSSVTALDRTLATFEKGDESVSSISVPSTKPVVLCFGGQISTFVGLDRAVFESASIFRHHLDQCDAVCRSIGLEGIYPEIFQRTPITDTVKLQTILFALQFSCAQSWIDCGVQVAAVVGHSFGELSALCTSGVLSLTDAVRLVAGRAALIRDSWGVEKGAMAAVEGHLTDVESILSEASLECPEEKAATVACYNGPRSFTIAGSDKAIDAVIETATKSKASPSIRTKKLNVTNAFHSTLVDPIVPALKLVAKNLTFRKPVIPIMRATETESLAPSGLEFVAEHLRSPVYFNHAVQRLAKQYPECIWLEAGSNSTITTMANRALGSSKTSHFQAVNITAENSFQFLTDATTSLWKRGLNVTFWPHHRSQTHEYPPLLLPPYQFEKSRHWLDLKKPQMAAAAPVSYSPPQAHEELPKTLWTFVGYQDSNQRSARFRINTMIKKFEEYVSGHVIAQAAPLCPSTLQLHIVIEALMQLRPEFAASGLQPQLQHLENHAPMCMDPSRLVWLDAETSDASSHEWSWKMVSHAARGSAKTTLHASGKLQFRSVDNVRLRSEFARYERLVGHQRCLRLLDGNDADDMIQGRTIYKTFAEVVDYGEMYRGVQKIAGKGSESAGRVVKEYTGESCLETPLFDSFCQVAGIFVNCMTDRSDQDICISNKIEHWMRSPNLRPGGTRPQVWDVYAYHHRPSEKTWVSDVFIFDSRNGALLEVILGIGYQRVSKAALGKVLSRLTSGSRTAAAATPSAPVAIETQRNLAVQESQKEPSLPNLPVPKKPGAPDISPNVRSLLANVSGIEPEDIKEDTALADIGIDSLMGMELAREIEAVFKCSLDQTELMEVVDFRSLIKCIQSALGPSEGSLAVEEVEDSGAQAAKVDQASPVVPDGTAVNVAEFLAEQIGLSEREVPPGARLVDLGVDSLLSMELRSDISSKFGVTLPDDVSIEELTVAELDGKINERAGNKGARLTNGVDGHINGVVNGAGQVNGTTSHMNGTSSPAPPEANLNIPPTTILDDFGGSKQLTDASGPRYDRPPKPLMPPPQKEQPSADCAARRAAVDQYVRKYTQGFSTPSAPTAPPQIGAPSGSCVLLTGATGSLGSHLAAHLAERADVSTVICLNRRSNSSSSVEKPDQRQKRAMSSRGISVEPATAALAKLKVLETDAGKPLLGLSTGEYDGLVGSVTHIVHNAWPMSVKRPLAGFEGQLRAMRNLLDLARDAAAAAAATGAGRQRRIGFQFVSSIATVGNHPLRTGKTLVPEARMEVESALPSGYAEAKLACEKMLDATLHRFPDRFRPMVARVGQIAGSAASGYWNPVEHLAFLIKSSQTLKALPALEGDLSWCPVNDVAATLADLLLLSDTASSSSDYPIYHIENPTRQPWAAMIATLADALAIPPENVIPFDAWVARVRRFPGTNAGTDNPAARLIEFLDEHFVRMACGGLVLDTARSREHSETLRNVGAVSEGLVRKYVRAWKEMGFLA